MQILRLVSLKSVVLISLALPLLLLQPAAQAQSNFYVSTRGGSIYPYTNWAMAATQLQMCVDASLVGSTIWVSNGLYNSGGKIAGGSTLTNRMYVNKNITIRSMNGPAVTTIAGGGVYANNPTRCVCMTAGSLIGFTLTNGNTVASATLANGAGGGVYGAAGVIVSNCIIRNCTAYDGGGACNATLFNCTIMNNVACDLGGGAVMQFGSTMFAKNCTISDNASLTAGGGAVAITLYNCRVVSNVAVTVGGGTYRSTNQNCVIMGNWAEEGGGVYGGYLDDCTIVNNTAATRGGGATAVNAANCLIYYNHAQEDAYANYNVAPYYLNCCTWPMPLVGAANITNAPLIASLVEPRLLPGSPCYNAGYNYAWMTNTDIEGNARILFGTVDIGAYEFAGASELTGRVGVAISTLSTQILEGVAADFYGQATGRVQQLVWSFGDGTGATNEQQVTHAWTNKGAYLVTLRVTNLTSSVTATMRVAVVTTTNYYVKPNGSDAAAGTNWVTAKLTIQAAVNAAPVGGNVWVSNGTYAAGGQTDGGQWLTNRVAIYKPLTVRSMNGPTVTTIAGGGTYDAFNAVRCVYLAEGATLDGFRLTNGCALGPSSQAEDDAKGCGGGYGGGVYAPSFGAVVTNCILGPGNSAYKGGGGYGGTYYNCDVLQNLAPDAASAGGGIYYGQMSDCDIAGNQSGSHGGGVHWGQCSGCTFISNSATLGGGAATSELVSCSFVGNTAANQGGGAWFSQLTGCSVISNQVTSAGSAFYAGGGVAYSTLNGCDVAYNYAGGSGGGAYLCAGSDNSLRYNMTDGSGGGIYNSAAGYPCTNWTVFGNVARINGGGCYNGTYYQCNIVSNRAGAVGGGAAQGSYYTCAFINNWAVEAGGLYQAGDSYNCTIVGNRAVKRGGGVFQASGTLYNSIVYYNTALTEDNYNGAGSLYNCCTEPLPSPLVNTISNAPWIASLSNPRLLADSPCYNAGANQGFMVSALDLAGTNRILFTTVDIGAYEFAGTDTLTGPLTALIVAAHTQIVAGFAAEFVGMVDGLAQGLAWDFGDGATLANLCNADHAWDTPGAYDTTLSAWNLDGSATATVRVQVVGITNLYVAPSGLDADPGTNWVTAKQTIQGAVDAAPAGAFIWVSNGLYDTGARVAGEQETSNRVVVSRAVTIYSVNGPGATVIAGSGGPLGPAAIRAVYLADGAALIGFSITNGAVSSNLLSTIPGFNSGGGVFCEAADCIISNCVVAGNIAASGGGVLGGTLYDCLVAGNIASNTAGTNCYGGGTYYSRLMACTISNNYAHQSGGGGYGGAGDGSLFVMNRAGRLLWSHGGGVHGLTLTNCTLLGNTAWHGGGAYAGTLYNCLVAGNVAVTNGGGCYTSYVYSCTISNNSAARAGGGACYGYLANSVLEGNLCNYQGGGAYRASLSRCTVRNNKASEGGGMHAAATYTFYASNCLVVANAATNGNGGGAHGYIMDSCTIVSNSAVTNGGGQYNNHCVNSLLANNTAAQGGGYYNQSGTAWSLRNSTFANNAAVSNGGGVYLAGTTLSLTNCIIWGNSAAVNANWYAPAKTNMNYTCTEPLPEGGAGNFTNDPLFADAAAGDFHLTFGSSCVDVGTNEDWMITGKDLTGNPRIYNAIVDLGPYEYGSTMVVLFDFSVHEENGRVIVCWQTASETDTLGFDVFREENGIWVKVNAAMIPAEGWPAGGVGASYCVADAGAKVDGTYRYKLVEYETTGKVCEYGPFERSAWLPRLSSFTATPAGVVIQWQSRAGELYDVLKAVDARGAYAPAATGLPATPPVNAWTDPAASAGAAFYRIEAR